VKWAFVVVVSGVVVVVSWSCGVVVVVVDDLPPQVKKESGRAQPECPLHTSEIASHTQGLKGCARRVKSIVVVWMKSS
jgi:hypothetical protein